MKHYHNSAEVFDHKQTSEMYTYPYQSCVNRQVRSYEEEEVSQKVNSAYLFAAVFAVIIGLIAFFYNLLRNFYQV